MGTLDPTGKGLSTYPNEPVKKRWDQVFLKLFKIQKKIEHVML